MLTIRNENGKEHTVFFWLLYVEMSRFRLDYEIENAGQKKGTFTGRVIREFLGCTMKTATGGGDCDGS